MNAVGVRFVYPIEAGRVTFSVDAGEVQRTEAASKQSVVITNANFHRDCPSNGHEEVKRHLEGSATDWAMYQEFLSTALSG